MTDTPHAFLVDMLAMHNTAAAYGCGLKPRLAQMLLNRHTPPRARSNWGTAFAQMVLHRLPHPA